MTKNEFQLAIFEIQQMIKKMIMAQTITGFAFLGEKERVTEIFRSLSYLMEELIAICPTAESKHQLLTQTIITNPKQTMSDEINLKEILNNIEVSYIQEALVKEKGIVSHAAKRLGLRRTTLVEKMKKFEMANQKEFSLIKEKSS